MPAEFIKMTPRSVRAGGPDAPGPGPESLDRTRRRMARIDEMAEPLRRLVHEHGLTVVNAFLEVGVRNPQQIAHLIGIVLDSPRNRRTASKD